MSKALEKMPIAEAQALVEAILINHSTAPTTARVVASALISAELSGQAGHGLSRVASYAAQARSGKVNGYATPRLLQDFGAFVRIDAQSGFAFPAIELAIDTLAERVTSTGISGAGIVRSHHCGQLGAHVEKLADHGFAALMMANTPKAIAPWGGRDAVFGTNPIAFAAPRVGAPPLVIDLSLSKVARGKIMAAEKAGKHIPEGWALAADGTPTTDPSAALAGTMVPMGDAKGAALALIVEILSATLIGANHAAEATSFFTPDGPPPGVGQIIFVFDVEAISGGSFAQRIEDLLGMISEQDGTRLSGAARHEQYAKALEENMISVPAHLMSELTTLRGTS